MVCLPRKKNSADRYYARNVLILLGSVDDCETSKSTLISKSVLIYDCIKFWCRQVFGLTGVLNPICQRFPVIKINQCLWWRSFLITAAGQLRGFTGFPFTPQQLELLQTDSDYHIQCTLILSTLNIVFFARIRQTEYLGRKPCFYYESWLL